MPGGLTDFWEQLRRRNVVKVGASYAVVAWIGLQAAEILLPTFGAPEWVMRVFAAILILAFPLVLVLAWVFEVTPEGIRRTSDVPEGESIRPVTSQRLSYLLAGLLCAAVIFIAVDQFWLDSTPAASSVPAAPAGREPGRAVLPNSVAVLPLENLTPTEENQYLAAGLHEEILNQLAKLRNVNVIARSAVLPYAVNRPPVAEIARALNVQSVMEGSIRYSGNRVRVTTQLVDASTLTQLWSETYDREADDLFAIESDVAMRVANALRAEFSSDEQRAISKPPTESREAYALYLRARTGTPNVQALLDEAIRIDPRFALAYAFKARLYAESIVNSTGSGARDDWRARVELATTNAERALSIDPNVGLAHLALGALYQRLWRWNEASESFRRAIELAPNDTQIMRDYAWHAAFAGDYAEGIRFARRQVELAPTVATTHMDLGIVLEYAGDFDGALESHRAALAIQPRFTISRQHAGLLAARAGDNAAAAADFQYLEGLFGGNVAVVFLPELAVGYSSIGRDDDARRLADRIFALAEQTDVGAGTLAMAYLAIGDADGAAAQLEIAAERVAKNEPDQGFFSLMHIANGWLAHPLLKQPRFEALRARLVPAR